MADYLVDTDVLVDHLRGAEPFEPRRQDRVSYSVITRAELFAGSQEAESSVATLLDGMAELVVTRAVAEAAGRIRRDPGIRLPDALIAATALEHDLRLVTRNRKHVTAVPRLKIAEA